MLRQLTSSGPGAGNTGNVHELAANSYGPETYVYDCELIVDAILGEIQGPFRVIEVWCASISMEEITIQDVPNGVRVKIAKEANDHILAREQRKPVQDHPLPLTYGSWKRDFVFEQIEGRFSLRPPGRVDYLSTGVLRICLLRDEEARELPKLSPSKVRIPTAGHNIVASYEHPLYDLFGVDTTKTEVKPRIASDTAKEDDRYYSDDSSFESGSRRGSRSSRSRSVSNSGRGMTRSVKPQQGKPIRMTGCCGR
jgi:hypothetical protein